MYGTPDNFLENFHKRMNQKAVKPVRKSEPVGYAGVGYANDIEADYIDTRHSRALHRSPPKKSRKKSHGHKHH